MRPNESNGNNGCTYFVKSFMDNIDNKMFKILNIWTYEVNFYF